LAILSGEAQATAAIAKKAAAKDLRVFFISIIVVIV